MGAISLACSPSDAEDPQHLDPSQSYGIYGLSFSSSGSGQVATAYAQFRQESVAGTVGQLRPPAHLRLNGEILWPRKGSLADNQGVDAEIYALDMTETSESLVFAVYDRDGSSFENNWSWVEPPAVVQPSVDAVHDYHDDLEVKIQLSDPEDLVFVSSDLTCELIEISAEEGQRAQELFLAEVMADSQKDQQEHAICRFDAAILAAAEPGAGMLLNVERKIVETATSLEGHGNLGGRFEQTYVIGPLRFTLLPEPD